MNISWKDFAQRRKVDLEMFRSMVYSDYVQWCEFRKVEPVSKESFDGVKNLLVNQPVEKPIPATEVTTVATHHFNEKQLKKLRKPALITLCLEQQCQLEGTETKSNLVSLLLNLNND